MSRRGVSGGTFVAALAAVAAGAALVWLATWLSPLVAADVAVRDGRLTDGLSEYRSAEARLARVPALQQLAPSLLGGVQANQVQLLYQMQRFDEAIEKAGRSTSVHGTHFWSACAMFARGAAEEGAEARLAWFERAEAAFREALTAAPQDWDTKYNYELTQSLLNRLHEEPETPRRLLFQLLRPQAPRSGGKAPAKRTG
jgi:tetratricopeptide (TPR) repeat protein